MEPRKAQRCPSEAENSYANKFWQKIQTLTLVFRQQKLFAGEAQLNFESKLLT